MLKHATWGGGAFKKEKKKIRNEVGGKRSPYRSMKYLYGGCQ
jgi:hypothetical protein